MKSNPPVRSPAARFHASASGTTAAGKPAFRARAGGGFELALFSGGDERVFLDPVTARTKYGTPQGCAEDEIWFSSSTASAVSARGSAAAAELWQSLVNGGVTLDEAFESIRESLTRRFGIAGTQTILAGSGTEATFLFLVLARMLCGARMTAIVVGCAETGRGVAAAAAGLHFLRHAAFADVVAGERLAGLEGLDINVDTVAIRDRCGALRPDADIDSELMQKAETARRAGRDVLIHRLEVSKTGHCAPSLAALAALAEMAPSHVLVLADACQLRCSPAHIQDLLRRGFLVSLTGSKFAGGPPFSGALLVPPSVIERLRPMPLPPGLAAYSAQLDWPASFRKALVPGFLPLANIGLALRWRAALAEITRFFSCPADIRSSIFARFEDEVAQRIAETAHLDLLPPPGELSGSWGHTVLCVGMRHRDGRRFDMAEAAAVEHRLREGNVAARPVHLGQAVAIGGGGFLRVALSAALTSDVAERVGAGQSFAEAFAPVAEALGEVFTAWPAAMAERL